MVVWFVGLAICALLYAIEYYPYVFASMGDSEWEDWRRPNGRWIGDRIRGVGAWEHAVLHQFTSARDPAVESARRGANAALAYAVGWLIVGFPIGAWVE